MTSIEMVATDTESFPNASKKLLVVKSRSYIVPQILPHSNMILFLSNRHHLSSGTALQILRTCSNTSIPTHHIINKSFILTLYMHHRRFQLRETANLVHLGSHPSGCNSTTYSVSLVICSSNTPFDESCGSASPAEMVYQLPKAPSSTSQ